MDHFFRRHLFDLLLVQIHPVLIQKRFPETICRLFHTDISARNLIRGSVDPVYIPDLLGNRRLRPLHPFAFHIRIQRKKPVVFHGRKLCNIRIRIVLQQRLDCFSGTDQLLFQPKTAFLLFCCRFIRIRKIFEHHFRSNPKFSQPFVKKVKPFRINFLIWLHILPVYSKIFRIGKIPYDLCFFLNICKYKDHADRCQKQNGQDPIPFSFHHRSPLPCIGHSFCTFINKINLFLFPGCCKIFITKKFFQMIINCIMFLFFNQ